MNIFSILGGLIAIVVLIISLKVSSDDLSIFFDAPSMFIVLGGTFAATSIAMHLNKVGVLLKVFVSQYIKGKAVNHADIIKNIMQLTEGARNGKSFTDLAGETKDHFLKEGLELLGDAILNPTEVLDILELRAEKMSELRGEDTRLFKSLGKFPPAFGMMGTTIGMIVLLANLGGPDAMKMIGPAMGVCLITTLYGVIIANLGMIPIADNLETLSKQNTVKNEIIIEGIKHIIAKSNPILVAEDLNSFLLPGQRLNWKDAK